MTGEKAKIVQLRDHKHTSKDDARSVVLENIVVNHGAALRRFLTVRLRGQADVEDVIQDIFLRLSALPDVETRFAERPQTLRNYLFAMAANMLRDRARRAKVRQTHAHDSFEETEISGHSVSPEHFLAVKQDIGRMQDVLLKLKPKHRHAFVLSRFKYMPNKDVADALGVSVSTVEKYISKALVALREELI